MPDDDPTRPDDPMFAMPPQARPRWERFRESCEALAERSGRAGNYFDSEAPLHEIAELCQDLCQAPPDLATLPVFLRGHERLHGLRDRMPDPEAHDPLDGEAPPVNLYLSDLDTAAANLGAVLLAFEEGERKAARPQTDVPPVTRAGEAETLDPMVDRIDRLIRDIPKVKGALVNVDVKLDMRILENIKLDLNALAKELGNWLVDLNWSAFFHKRLTELAGIFHALASDVKQIDGPSRLKALAFIDDTARFLNQFRAWLGKFVKRKDLGPKLPEVGPPSDAIRASDGPPSPDEAGDRVDPQPRDFGAVPFFDEVDPVPGTVFCDRLRDGSPGPRMVVIPPGRFVIGSPEDEADRDEDEGPRHEVTFERPFALGRFAVTFGDYDRFAEAAGRDLPGDQGWGRGRRPVIDVSWNDAQAYLTWLSSETGQPCRLPSEAEWEYACRAGTTTPFSTGATISTDRANYDGNHVYGPGRKGLDRGRTTEVGAFPANPFGLCDMHGNVREWVADCWHDGHSVAPPDGGAWTTGGCRQRVLRGGSWNGAPRYLRSAYRYRGTPDYRYINLGFRIARTL